MRRLKQLVAMMLVVCMLITLCPSDVSAATSKAAVKSVTVTNLVTNKLVLKKGTKFQVKPRVVVTGKISKKVTYVSSNKKIVIELSMFIQGCAYTFLKYKDQDPAKVIDTLAGIIERAVRD